MTEYPRLTVTHGDALDNYQSWPTPQAIVSDGAYGVLGFDGDTDGPRNLPAWYEPHVVAWSRAATPNTTLWFWNTEIGWATVHPLLEAHGWRYVNSNVWNKGVGHIAGNINTKTLRRFPVVTEVCVQYAFEARVNGLSLQQWLLSEWRRSGLPARAANAACGVKNAASRKYFDQGAHWYFPPPEAMSRLVEYANTHGAPEGRPYFTMDRGPVTPDAWGRMRAKFVCPHGVTNVWDRSSLHSPERIRVEGRAVHLNQKPLDLMSRIIEASTDPYGVVWEPFGGLFTASIAAALLNRRGYATETNPAYFQAGQKRAGTLGLLAAGATREDPC